MQCCVINVEVAERVKGKRCIGTAHICLKERDDGKKRDGRWTQNKV